MAAIPHIYCAMTPGFFNITHRELHCKIQPKRQGPVSYTHLDVYKRQAMSFTAGAGFTRSNTGMGSSVTVSYTHLDVYKRQQVYQVRRLYGKM